MITLPPTTISLSLRSDGCLAEFYKYIIIITRAERSICRNKEVIARSSLSFHSFTETGPKLVKVITWLFLQSRFRQSSARSRNRSTSLTLTRFPLYFAISSIRKYIKTVPKPYNQVKSRQILSAATNSFRERDERERGRDSLS